MRIRLRLLAVFAGLVSLWCASAAQTAPPDTLGLSVELAGGPYADFPDLMRQKRWGEVAAKAEELKQRNPQDPRARYWLGISRLYLHEPVAAAQALRSAEKLGLNTALSHEGLGLAYYDLNQFVLFEEQMAKSAQLGPGDAKPHYYLGLYQLTIRSDTARALEQFEKAMELQPDDWKSVYQTGNCLDLLGKLDQAHERYARAATLIEKQGVPSAWPYRGMSHLLLDSDPQMALSFAQRAATLDPADYSNHLLLAKIYERLGNLSEAVREAKIAAEENPTGSTTRYTLYKLYRDVGDPQAANELKLFQEIVAVYGPD
jgi:tetratricopeptide (TPR) repeat protein